MGCTHACEVCNYGIRFTPQPRNNDADLARTHKLQFKFHTEFTHDMYDMNSQI